MDAPARDDTFERLRGLWRRRRRPALLVAALVAAAAMGFVAGLPDVYQAQATILVDRANLPATVATPATPDEIETKIGALGEETLSRARLSGLIQRFRLYPELRTASEDDVVKQMRRDITLGLDRPAVAANSPTVSLSVAYRGTNPVTIAEVTNALAGFFAEGGGDDRARQSSAAADLLRTQMEDVKKKMEAQEKLIGDYKTRHGADLPEQLVANLATLERLNAQIERNKDWQQRLIERRETAARYVAVPGEPARIAPETVEARLDRMRGELADLRARYSDRHPDVVRLREQIALLEKSASQAPATATVAASSAVAPAAVVPPAPLAPTRDDGEMRRLQDEEQELRHQVVMYQSRVEAAPSRDQELRELTRDYEATRTLYASLFQRDAETRLAGRLEQRRSEERFRVLDAALPPATPLGPNRLRLILLALGGALGAALGTGLLLELFDTTFHSTDQLQGVRVPVIAGIPWIRTARGTLRRRAAGALAVVVCLVMLSAVFLLSYRVAFGSQSLSYLALRFGS
jgi:polysaccharide chain length determinant protein (PEP-CTERM system associated)